MLVKKTLQFITLFAIVASSFLPAFNAKAYGGYYTYRSTVFGTGVSQTGQYVYEIKNQKDRFNVGESVFFLSRIFNITNVTSFSFKHEIRGAGVYKEFYSDYYTPNKNWWAEIYYWKEIGQLPAGNYETKIYLNIDNEGYKLRDTKNFTVESMYAYVPYYGPAPTYPTPYPAPTPDPYYGYTYNQPYFVDAPHYSYNWTHTGKNIRKTGDYSYELVSQATEFTTNEDVYVLAYLSDIKGIDNFRVKFELWLDGNRFYKKNEVPILRPGRERWAYNYSWGNLGKLPRGQYQVRTFIQLDGGSYRHLNTQTIYVGDVLGAYEKPYRPGPHQPTPYRPTPCKPEDNSYYRDAEHYKYDWTKLGTEIRSDGGYDYSIPTPKTTFYNDEYVKALTRTSEIRGIDKFQIKYKLYKGNAFKKEYVATEQKPSRNRWNYNYSSYNLGMMTETGSYSVKVYISIDGGIYKLLDTKTFTVNQRVAYYRDKNRYGDRSHNDGYYRPYQPYQPYNDNNYFYNRPYYPYYR